MAAHYIVVEGPIGVGKTSVVERLAERMEARTVLEEWGQNPFLTPFYEGKAGAAFQIELFYLLSRYRQQQELTQRTLFERYTLSDYLFEKSKLFAYLNLDDSELLIYEKLYAMLIEGVPRPDLVVYLQAPTEILLRRIRTRGRPEEARLSEDYLAEVNRAYNHYFFHYTGHAPARGQHRGRGLREARGGRRRPAQADPRHEQGHAVLRSPGQQALSARVRSLHAAHDVRGP